MKQISCPDNDSSINWTCVLASQSIVSLKQDTNLSVGLSQLYVEIAEAIAHFTDAEIPNQHMPQGKMHQILSFHKIR